MYQMNITLAGWKTIREGGDDMQRGLMTEYEWRCAAQRKAKRKPEWWGAQCVYPTGRQRLMRSCSFRWSLLVGSLACALMLPLLVPAVPQEAFEDCILVDSAPAEARKVSAISYQLPTDLVYQQQIYPEANLMRGKLLLIDREHPLPNELLPPNTVSIAQYGAGMVPVRSLKLRSGYETIDALKLLFAQLRTSGADGLAIQQATVSTAQQRQAMILYTRELMQNHPPEQAVSQAAAALEWPGTGSLLQEYTVEIHAPDGLPLEESEEGQTFLQLCWRYGFIREALDKPYRFRYVGKAHATAMTYLDLDFRRYLDWLHQKKRIAVSAGGRLQYLILCEPVLNGYATFSLPEGAKVEVSMDNTGYALAACTF